jgi:predicted DNA-binding protein
MASPITLRLDPEIRRRVARIARQRRTTTSKVLREAITSWVAREDAGETVYDRVADLIGAVHGGDPKLSENTGRKFTELLKARSKRP